MKHDFGAAMRRAARATRAYNLAEATRIIQDSLTGRSTPGSARADLNPDVPAPSQKSLLPAPRPPDADVVEPSVEARSSSADAEAAKTSKTATTPESKTLHRLRRPLGEVVRALRGLRSGASDLLPSPSLPFGKKASPPPPLPEGAQFLTRSFSCAAGSRSYKLYLPASAHDRPRGLVVMLHGCKQDADDFAAGTNMNRIAEAHGLMVAYPSQARSANTSACWNWFSSADQMRGSGEPSIIAGITRDIMLEFGLDRHQVFAAGLSAGGAMAAVMSETYPDLFAAVGIHSGLAYASAHDVISAFAAMGGNSGPAPSDNSPARADPFVRTIVFHGSGDRTVHPVNASRILSLASSRLQQRGSQQEDSGSSGGRSYTRTVVSDETGIPAVEHWLIKGGGHAWSGGHPSGSYADPRGPDASAEMMRFFLNQT